jgi:aspartyl-tRNA(Asn)/glutamyl-tRNA(Gln) amidotransferase subunit A
MEGEIFNASSKTLDGFKAPYSSTVFEKIDAAGAILIGINQMDEFAMGSSGETSYYAKTKNPFDLDRVPGGSSSGPAAVVASGQVVFSLGTDTGGSIRQPASFCDVVGLKPTYGLISRFGVMAMASSFDQVGAFTNTVADNLLITKILAGKDERDQSSLESSELIGKLEKIIEDQKSSELRKQKLIKTSKPLKIGIPEEFYNNSLHPEIKKALETLQEKLTNLGHKLVPVSLPLSKYAIAVYYMTMTVEVASNLERIDGVRFAPQQDSFEESYFEYREKYFGDEPKRRIMLGTYASSAGYYDAYYNHAQKVRKLAKDDFDKVFSQCDVILSPVTPDFPFKFGEKTSDPLAMYLADVFTCGINPVKIPGLSVPLGLFEYRSDNQNVMLPAGCQILGNEQSEDLIFALAAEVEAIK